MVWQDNKWWSLCSTGNVIIRESNGKDFSGFSKDADKIIDKIIFFANALASGSLKIEDVKRIGL